jgi:hypothetical protein
LDLFETKRSALKERGMHEIDFQINQLKEAIGPVAYAMAQHLIKKVKANALSQLEMVLDCAMKDGGRSAKQLVEENLSFYEAHELFSAFYNRKHPRYDDLKIVIARCFEARITAMRELFSGNGNDYDSLVRSRFAAKEDALFVLKKEFAENTKALRIFEENPKLLELPFGIKTRHAIDSFENYLGFSLCRLSENLDKIYTSNRI